MTCPVAETRVLFVYSILSSFIRTDYELLEKNFVVRKSEIETFLIPSKGKSLLVFLRLIKGILWSDVAYTWFADVNAFFIVLFCIILRKKSVIVVGGYDVIYVPEINYGTLKSLKNRVRAKFTLEHATRILPFSNYAKDRVLGISGKANIQVIPLACNTAKFKPVSGGKDNIVTTVCYIDRDNIKRKGLTTFIESAKSLPQLKFVLIGRLMDDSAIGLREAAPPNTEFTGYVPEKELIGWYQRTKVYCQLSFEEGEGAGGALGEAMASACVPVVSSKAVALTETVGGCGFYVPYGDVVATSEAIKMAADRSSELGQIARDRMRDLFSMEKREKRLVDIINKLCAHTKSSNVEVID